MSNDLIESSSQSHSTPTSSSNLKQLGGAQQAAGSSPQSQRQPGFDMNDFTVHELGRDALPPLDEFSLEDIVEAKISRFLDQMGSFFHENDNLHHIIMRRVEKPLLRQVMKRTGGNQVHAARILGINRNTLRKKIKIYDL